MAGRSTLPAHYAHLAPACLEGTGYPPVFGKGQVVRAFGAPVRRNAFDMNASRRRPLTGLLSALAVRCTSPIRFRIEREVLIIAERQVAPEVDTQFNHVTLPAL